MLVYHDLLGLTEGHLPRFVKRYANLSREIRDALEAYAHDVREGAFPEDEHTYEMPAGRAGAISLGSTDQSASTSPTSATAKMLAPKARNQSNRKTVLTP